MSRMRRTAQGRRSRPGQVRSWYLWVVGAVVVLAVLFMLARTLSSAPPSVTVPRVLASGTRDLEIRTRMLGDIELDPDLSARLPPDLARQLQTVDSLITLRDWDGALAQLRRMRSPEDSEVTAVVEEYTGFCYLPTWPDHTLHSYRRAMSADSGDDSTRQFRLAFAAGYLFQMYGFPDSALAEYSTARSWAPSGSDEWALHSDEDVGLPISQRLLMPALYNNLALAYELTGDTAAALSFYDSAALLVDTTRDVPSARTVRGNLRRLEH